MEIQCAEVFPTRVGVNRYWANHECGKLCIPHTRGGEPDYPEDLRRMEMYSPHAWG